MYFQKIEKNAHDIFPENFFYDFFSEKVQKSAKQQKRAKSTKKCKKCEKYEKCEKVWKW